MLSNGEKSLLTMSGAGKDVLFRGLGPHVACSYSCYNHIAYIELYEEPTKDGRKLTGVRIMARDGSVVTSIGSFEPNISLLTSAIESNKVIDEESKISVVNLVTINEFERIVGVQSHAIGSVHYDLKFMIASATGDYCTVVVGKTNDGFAVKEGQSTEVKSVKFIEKYDSVQPPSPRES